MKMQTLNLTRNDMYQNYNSFADKRGRMTLNDPKNKAPLSHQGL